jgi:hypothetical protein
MRMFVTALMCFCWMGTAVHAEEPDVTILNDVLKSIESQQNPPSGKGIVKFSRVESKDGAKTCHYLLDFAFKNAMTRTDMFQDKDGNKGDMRALWVKGPTSSLNYAGTSIAILAKPSTQFDKSLGYDFHPDTFTKLDRVPVANMIRAMMNYPEDIDVLLDERRGLLIRFDHGYTSREKELVEIVLSPKFDYRVLSCRQEFTDSEGTQTTSVSIAWDKFDGFYFPRTGRFSITYRKTGQVRENLFTQQEFVLQEFTPEAVIDDAYFTLEGINPPVGTTIVDKVLGLQYTHGSLDKSYEDSLFDTLERAEFTGKVGDHEIAESSAPPVDRDPQQSPVVPDEQVPSDHSAGGRLCILLLLVCLLVISACFLVWRIVRK